MFNYDKFEIIGLGTPSVEHTWECEGYKLVIWIKEGYKSQVSIFTPEGKREIKFTASKKSLYVEHPITRKPVITPEGAFAEKVAQGMMEIIDAFKGYTGDGRELPASLRM